MGTGDHTATLDKEPLIIAGIGGGVAAYKAVEVVSSLRQRGADIHVAMSESAERFVTPLTFSAVSGRKVLTSIFPEYLTDNPEDTYPHLYPATRADIFILMPATANMIARLANGMGNDIVSACALSLPITCRKIFCPAMNREMWEQDSVQCNVRSMEGRGWQRLGPDKGALACGMEGAGRMSEPEEIIDYVWSMNKSSYTLVGRKVMILSGPTREHLDPVRYIGNPSSGIMGKELAIEAVRRGADVHLVTGPVDESILPVNERIRIHSVIGADDMLNTASGLMNDIDIVIHAAAVADYKPAQKQEDKGAKEEREWNLHLVPTPDIAATLNRNKRANQVSIGFSLQTSDGYDIARTKLRKKHLDGIIVNHVDSIGKNYGDYAFISAGPDTDTIMEWGTIPKEECAGRILDESARILNTIQG